MINYLSKNMQLGAYEKSDIKIRKEFMVNYHAMNLKLKDSKNEAKSKHVIRTRTRKHNNYNWMNKKQLIDKFGLEAAIAKIEATKVDGTPKLKTQPQKESGKDTEWTLPYTI